MAITLTITDNADGTGGIATVAGSVGGSTNTVYRCQFTGRETTLPWVSLGTITGDGSLSVSGPVKNYWLWYVSNVNGATTTVTAPVLKALTNATYEAVRTRLVNAVRDRLLLLNLARIEDSVFVRNSQDDPVGKYPSAVVIRDGTPDVYQGGNNNRDDIGIGIQVLLQSDDGTQGDDTAAAERDLWRERCERAFRNQRIAGAPEIYTCTVEPAAMVAEPIPRAYQKTVSAFTIRFVSREIRGLTT